ncbi:hypothetical protein MtrunA17_Chr3g0105381 [Medicago truncatula]|uniref:Uncharacterized protein n=1 Tax=Medicago truncatula TaxID=3880 RepID=A0A396IXN5_MEDTR|nr:hypothetical protein MtrunA17_Chr3g0105381 [Medicago truncatula]
MEAPYHPIYVAFTLLMKVVSGVRHILCLTLASTCNYNQSHSFFFIFLSYNRCLRRCRVRCLCLYR